MSVRLLDFQMEPYILTYALVDTEMSTSDALFHAHRIGEFETFLNGICDSPNENGPILPQTARAVSRFKVCSMVLLYN